MALKSEIPNFKFPMADYYPNAAEDLDRREREYLIREQAKAEARERNAWKAGIIAGEQIERDRAAHQRHLAMIFVPLLALMAGLVLGAVAVKFFG